MRPVSPPSHHRPSISAFRCTEMPEPEHSNDRDRSAAQLVGPRSKQSRKLPTFLGELGEPIQLRAGQGLAGASPPEHFDEYVESERARKLALLAKAYGCEVDGDIFWMSLCLELANDLVPGFRVAGPIGDRYNGTVGRGHPSGDRLDDYRVLTAVRAQQSKHRGNVAATCRALCGEGAEFAGRSPLTLERIYRRHTIDPVPTAVALAREITSGPP